eukprot:51367-Rhodomonas_salina.1
MRRQDRCARRMQRHAPPRARARFPLVSRGRFVRTSHWDSESVPDREHHTPRQYRAARSRRVGCYAESA